MQPGDTVTVLRPPCTEPHNGRVVLVHRFVRGVNERTSFLVTTTKDRVTSAASEANRRRRSLTLLRCQSSIR